MQIREPNILFSLDALIVRQSRPPGWPEFVVPKIKTKLKPYLLGLEFMTQVKLTIFIRTEVKTSN